MKSKIVTVSKVLPDENSRVFFPPSDTSFEQRHFVGDSSKLFLIPRNKVHSILNPWNTFHPAFYDAMQHVKSEVKQNNLHFK